MKALIYKKLFVLSAVAFLGLVACDGGKKDSQKSDEEQSSGSSEGYRPRPSEYVRESDDDVYARVLGDFAAKYDGVNNIADDDLRFVRDARAEAALLASGVFVPTTTQGGAYTLSRIAPRTAPYVFFGNDSDKVKSLVITSGQDSFIKKTDREALKDAWETAMGGGAAYDPAAMLQARGYTLGTEYKTTFSTAPATLDIFNTSEQADTETLVQVLEGLVQYDNLGQLQPAMATSWEHNDEYTVYKFTIRQGAKWYTADKSEYGPVTADDFVAGFQHMLDCAAGLEYLMDGVVKGVEEYNYEDGDFEDVGVYVEEGTGKLVFELEKPETFFLTRLAYSPFYPMNRAFFLSRGGAFGEDFDPTADTYKFGLATDKASQLYNGPYIPTTWDAVDASTGSIVLEKNNGYWDAANVKVTKASWIYDDGSNPDAFYAATRRGDYPGMGLSAANGLLDKAREDGLFDLYAYVSDTNATTFFGGMNTNRGTFKLENGNVASAQTEANKVLTHEVLNNVHFRRAILYGWDRANWNAITRGEDLKSTNLRNMYTTPDFVALGKDVEYEGKTYAKGRVYGDLVEQFLKDDFNMEIDLSDGQDGWYNLEKAKAEMALCKQELGEFWPDGEKVIIDNVAYGPSVSMVAEANGFEQILERALGEYIDVQINTAANGSEYYACGYRTQYGYQMNQDLFYGSGWGPDYGDPSTYLDTFTAGGYMNKVIGLY